MTALVRYEQARTALAACHSVDEVKDIRDRAEAMAAYARLAKDNDMILWATEIKVRAERQAGAMLADAKERGDRAPVGRPPENSNTNTLGGLGISSMQSSRWQSLASMTDEHFETAVATAKDTAGQVTTAFMLREAGKARAGKPKQGAKAEAIREELKAAKERGVSMLCSYARLLLGAISASEGFTEEERELLTQVQAAISSTKGVLQ
jgi:hypothetical protein